MATISPIARQLTPWLALFVLMLLVSLVVAPFLAPLTWAGVLAYASWPLTEWLRTACRGREALAAGVATALAALTLIAPLLWLAWLGQQEVGRLYGALQTYIAAPPPLPDWLQGIPWLGDWLAQQRVRLLSDPQGMNLAVRAWLAAHVGEAAALAGDVGKNLLKLILTLTILFFFYRDGKRIVGELRHVLACFIGPRAHGYIAAVAVTTRAVIHGVLFTALAQGAVAGLGYWVAGLASPVTLGVLTAICALIPFATPLAWGSAGAWLFVQGETGAAIGVWLWGVAVVSQLDNVLRPFFISSVGEIPFLLVLFGVFGGLLAFGMVGLFVGPVVLAVGWAVWREWATHLEPGDSGAVTSLP
ncbi:MAG TPA: AI-2E family transporter [Rhodocyclaceae bacterium]|nr:AI-2E family transporter [Rhodocyclaceae bacterium]